MKMDLEVWARLPLHNKVSHMNNTAINKLTTFGRFRGDGKIKCRVMTYSWSHILWTSNTTYLIYIYTYIFMQEYGI